VSEFAETARAPAASEPEPHPDLRQFIRPSADPGVGS
jgi:hypothetical protein